MTYDSGTSHSQGHVSGKDPHPRLLQGNDAQGRMIKGGGDVRGEIWITRHRQRSLMATQRIE